MSCRTPLPPCKTQNTAHPQNDLHAPCCCARPPLSGFPNSRLNRNRSSTRISLAGSWDASDVDHNGALSLGEFEGAYASATQQLDRHLNGFLGQFCPEQMEECRGTEDCFNALEQIRTLGALDDQLAGIYGEGSAPALVDVKECVVNNLKDDCEAEWSPCSASCHQTCHVLKPQDPHGLGAVCSCAEGDERQCAADTDGCHEVLWQSIYSVRSNPFYSREPTLFQPPSPSHAAPWNRV